MTTSLGGKVAQKIVSQFTGNNQSSKVWWNYGTTVGSQKTLGILYCTEIFRLLATAHFIFDKFNNPTLLLTTKDNNCPIVILSRFGLEINTLAENFTHF